MLTKDDIKILYVEDLAKIINRTKRATEQLLKRSPESLPPRLVFPGSSRRMWLEKDVIEWINNCRTNKTTEDK